LGRSCIWRIGGEQWVGLRYCKQAEFVDNQGRTKTEVLASFKSAETADFAENLDGKRRCRNGAATMPQMVAATMSKQTIQFGYDKDGVWLRVRGRRSVFLDTNCWINLADGKRDSSVRLRETLRAAVAGGIVFCPLSWGILEELFDQSGPSLPRTASLMEELSLNAVFVIREELYAWELSRSIRRFIGKANNESLNGLFTPPAAFVGSGPAVSIDFPDGISLSPQAQAHAQAYMKKHLSEIGVAKLAQDMGGNKKDRTPPAYSSAAKKAREEFGGDKLKLFVMEAGDCFRTYVTPLLFKYPPNVIVPWLKHLGRDRDEVAFFQNALAEFPALYNYTEIMMVADSQPDRKDKHNHFMDNEIMVAPLAYCNVFVSEDKGMKDIAAKRTKILGRTKCQYLDRLDALECWLTERAA